MSVPSGRCRRFQENLLNLLHSSFRPSALSLPHHLNGLSCQLLCLSHNQIFRNERHAEPKESSSMTTKDLASGQNISERNHSEHKKLPHNHDHNNGSFHT